MAAISAARGDAHSGEFNRRRTPEYAWHAYTLIALGCRHAMSRRATRLLTVRRRRVLCGYGSMQSQ